MSSPAAEYPSARNTSAQWLLIALPLLALLPKLWIITHSLYASDASVFNTGFGFGNYIRSLAEQGVFNSCSALPFQSCDLHACVHATRMPGVPVFLWLLSSLVGSSAVSVAIAKCTLLALLSVGFLAVLSRDVRVTAWGLLILCGLYLGPQALKHGAALDYEEGMLIDLSLCLAVALAYSIRPSLTEQPGRRAAMAYAAVAIAVVMYMTKTTALLTLVVVLAIVLCGHNLRTTGKLACLALAAVPMATWGMHNLRATGVFSISSSWNGENLLRGYDSGALAIYPEISLDRIFDSSVAVLDDGTRVSLGNYTARGCFKDEWSWSSSYSSLALQWLRDHPLPALTFLAHKSWVALLEVRHTPTYGSATDKSADTSRMLSAVMIAWMVAARIVFFLLVARVLLDLHGGRNRSYGWVLAVLAAACAPYMIVFAYQRHMIPVLELAGALLVLLYFATPVAFAAFPQRGR